MRGTEAPTVQACETLRRNVTGPNVYLLSLQKPLPQDRAGQAARENCKMTRVVLQNRCGTVQKTDLQDHGFSRPAFPERFAGPRAQSDILVVSPGVWRRDRKETKERPQWDWACPGLQGNVPNKTEAVHGGVSKTSIGDAA